MRRLGAAALLVSIGLACGGGSGSGDGQLARIDTDTAENIARAVVTALDLTADLSTIGAEVTGGGVASAASRAGANAMRVALLGFVPLAAGSPIGPIAVECETDGTVTLTGTVTSPDTLTAGDRFTSVFDQCKELDANGNVLTLDGQLDYTVVAFSGNLAELFTLTLNLAFCGPNTSSACNQAFTVEEETVSNTRTFAVEGSARTVVDSTTPPLVKSSATGSTLALTEPAPPDPIEASVALRSFLTTLSQDDDKKTYELTGNGRLASTRFDEDPTTDDGEVRYNVTETLTGVTGNPPDAGIVLVTGSSSAMQIDPVDDTNVLLELDLDGNGTFDDATISTTWAALGL